jgi:two-component system chemotaxis sensor kinase CheA
VVESAGKKTALLVDEVITEQQIVVKPIAPGLGDTDFLSGAAILSDGRVGLILNVDRLNVPPAPMRTKQVEQAEVSA